MRLRRYSAYFTKFQAALRLIVLQIFLITIAISGCTHVKDQYDFLIGHELSTRRERKKNHIKFYSAMLTIVDTCYVSHLVYNESIMTSSPFNILGYDYTKPIEGVKVNVGPNGYSYNRITINNNRVEDWERLFVPTFMGPQRLEDIRISPKDYCDGLYEVLNCLVRSDQGLEAPMKDLINKARYLGCNEIVIWDFASQKKVGIKLMMKLLSVDESDSVLKFTKEYDKYVSKMGSMGFAAKYL